MPCGYPDDFQRPLYSHLQFSIFQVLVKRDLICEVLDSLGRIQNIPEIG
jgi:hypothetical protein